MDFAMGVGAAASNERSDTRSPEENYSGLVPISHDVFQTLKNNRSLLCEVLLKKFSCDSTLSSPALEGNIRSLVEPVFRKRLASGLELSVWKDDLTKHAVDAVVNAANEDLRHIGGLAGALERAGGPDIQAESLRHVAMYGKVPVGAVAVTGAGKLPCKMLFHAVGPQWYVLGSTLSTKMLQSAITNILNCAQRMQIKTIAIPALGSGIFQVPVDLCADVILQTIHFYLQSNQVMSLKEIHLVSNEERTVAAFKAASEVFLGGNEPKSPDVTPPFDMKLQLVQGHIEHQKSDVIVNSVKSRSLQVGPVSKAILQQAGDQMERQFRERSSKLSSNSNPVLVTEGFKLSCRYVYHILWYSDDHNPQRLKEAMKICLEKCLHPAITSISFPALGAGTIGMKKAAEIMFDGVLTFAKNHPRKQLTVKLVIFPEDKETYTTFKTEMTKFNSCLNDNNVSQWTREEQRTNGLEARSPVVHLTGSTKEKVQEAEAWIKKLLISQDHYVIENNHILYFGKEEHYNLSLLQKTTSVSILEQVTTGKTYLEIKGDRPDLVEVVMKIECMLCDIQEQVARKNEKALFSFLEQQTDQQSKLQNEITKKVISLRYPDPSYTELHHEKRIIEKCGLQVIKVEELKNKLLIAAYQKKKKMMEMKTQQSFVGIRAFQQVPYQFLDAVHQVGFHRFYTASYDPQYGAGIYFTTSLKNLADKVKTFDSDKFIYVIEAEVLKGSSCQGHRSIIVPPPLSAGAIDCHDSVVDSELKPETIVIFNGMQAIPRFLWTCIRDHEPPQGYSSGPVSSSWQNWKPFSNGSSVD